ncbi:hormone receptor 4 [Anastrepha ludens]|uniref:hormone receptor 4 n=1 Tax=Anastrepha ludens TaxID=28586 RepID=UPI0023B0A01E|nr:hormone receptor 4 [Anastrepha ludens]XP_053951915.1 hormone receptor 4 [Anastrepha ludens]
MDIMDIQAVESKLSDVTVTPIPRSQVQNFYNYQQQREQREQQPQIQISAIHHPPRDRSGCASSSSVSASTVFDLHHSVLGGSSSKSSGGRDLYSKRERDYHQQSTSTSAAAAVAALQYTQQLQAQLALLQQQSNTIASPASTQRSNSSSSGALNNGGGNTSAGSGGGVGVVNVGNGAISVGAALGASSNAASILSAAQSQLKYPLSTSPVVITTQTSANITTPMTSTANLPTAGTSAASNGLSKYAQLLAVIEEMGRDIRPTYTGSRSSTERLKRGIVHARILVRECLMETERSARQ